MITPTLPAVKMNLVRPREPVVGRVTYNELCMRGKSASFVKHLEIDVTDTALAGNFTAGQSFGVVTPGVDDKGKPHKVRLYSIACPTWGEDGNGNILSTTPKRLIDEHTPQRPTDDPTNHRLFLGVCSIYLCDLNEGDEVQLTGPSGRRFLLPKIPSEHNYLFVATGTGIAPFRGMLMELLEAPSGRSKNRVDLVMGVPYSTDLLYDDYFRRMAAAHENFHYHPALSREPTPQFERGVYVDQLIDTDMDTFYPLLSDERTLIYICGLAGMQMGMYRLLGRHQLTAGYLTLKDDMTAVPVEDWSESRIKRSIRPTGRCMLEVY